MLVIQSRVWAATVDEAVELIYGSIEQRGYVLIKPINVKQVQERDGRVWFEYSALAR